ncbi:hypothetical protein J4E90_002190 [Alternaria incomplexa]|uniref:uncharacterized protein n=1 Tax=Alternaria incomplexa TaxID=1187928 RepID=UPI00221E3C20|nr:uncharacterized protein J4E90_002190 [Alternaria incomplexa]KAI4920050.1 hypothetical protein J4E90_002190 [Alternaria incomplexa]
MGQPKQAEPVYNKPSTTSSPASSTRSIPSVPPPPYFKSQFISPSSFKSVVNAKLDKPAVSLFRLSIRIFQLAFALASGISYAIELSHATSTSKTDFIFAQVVFGLTLLVLVIDSVTVRNYRVTWIPEWILAVLWIASFGLFYTIYLNGDIEQGYQNVDVGRMKRAVWCDLINALLWMGSALFSSVMCCSGIKATIKAKMERRRQRKEARRQVREVSQMEQGVIDA